jgi:WD40 repeat protein
MSYSHDKKSFVTSFYNGELKEWDRDKKTYRLIKKLDKMIDSVVYSSDDKRLLFGSYDTIIEMDRFTGDILHEIKNAHHNNIVYVLYFCHETKVISVSEDGEIKTWDLASGKMLSQLQAYSGLYVLGCDFSGCEFESDELREIIRQHGGFRMELSLL